MALENEIFFDEKKTIGKVLIDQFTVLIRIIDEKNRWINEVIVVRFTDTILWEDICIDDALASVNLGDEKRCFYELWIYVELILFILWSTWR